MYIMIYEIKQLITIFLSFALEALDIIIILLKYFTEAGLAVLFLLFSIIILLLFHTAAYL